MKKITDTMRLNQLERMRNQNAPQNWVGVLYDGTIVLDEPREFDKQYEIVSNARPTIRQAIDAVIRSERRAGK